jgi:hypothetical protein
MRYFQEAQIIVICNTVCADPYLDPNWSRRRFSLWPRLISRLKLETHPFQKGRNLYGRLLILVTGLWQRNTPDEIDACRMY